uniref:Uncharacterized protein n=2 Tax=Brassica TaxID=3705 RepID=A0A0D3D8P1_BRAOL
NPAQDRDKIEREDGLIGFEEEENKVIRRRKQTIERDINARSIKKATQTGVRCPARTHYSFLTLLIFNHGSAPGRTSAKACICTDTAGEGMKSSWPELVGKRGEEAKDIINRENTKVKAEIISEDAIVLAVVVCERVYVRS